MIELKTKRQNPNTWCQVPSSKCQMPSAECLELNAKCQMPNAVASYELVAEDKYTTPDMSHLTSADLHSR